MLWMFIAFAVLLIFLLVVSGFCYRLVFYNANIREHDPYVVPPGDQYAKVGDTILKSIAALDALTYEQVNITSHDGIRLSGRYYHFYDDAPLQIMFHGYRSCGLQDMCGGSMLARKNGCNVLLVDQRAHGKSGGHVITFGVEERYDCLSWTQYAIKRFGGDVKILFVGLSMGAATVLMASGLPLPENVVGIIADCPYTSPGAIIRSVCRSMHLPSVIVYPFVLIGALIYGKFCIWKGDAVRAVANTKVPILIFHGEDDRLVPCEMSRQICAENSSMVTLVTIPEAGHGLSYMLDPAQYETSVEKFLHSIGI